MNEIKSINISKLQCGDKVRTYGGEILEFLYKLSSLVSFPYRFKNCGTNGIWEFNSMGINIGGHSKDTIVEILSQTPAAPVVKPKALVEKIYQFTNLEDNTVIQIRRDDSTVYIDMEKYILEFSKAEAEILSNILKEFSQEIPEKKS